MSGSSSLRSAPSDKLRFLAETVLAEAALLQITDGRLFAETMDAQRAGTLRDNVALAERVDAFVARFGRLQDTIGDKLLPAVFGLACRTSRTCHRQPGTHGAAGVDRIGSRLGRMPTTAQGHDP